MAHTPIDRCHARFRVARIGDCSIHQHDAHPSRGNPRLLYRLNVSSGESIDQMTA